MFEDLNTHTHTNTPTPHNGIYSPIIGSKLPQIIYNKEVRVYGPGVIGSCIHIGLEQEASCNTS